MGENRHGESPVLAVPRDDRRCEMLGRGAAGGLGEPLFSGRDGVDMLLGGTGHSVQGGPTEGGGGNIAETFGGITPATVFIGVIGEPLQAAPNEGGVIRVSGGLDMVQGADSDRGGKGAAGEFTFPMAFSMPFGQQGGPRGGQRSIESGGVEVHCAVPSVGLRFS